MRLCIPTDKGTATLGPKINNIKRGSIYVFFYIQREYININDSNRINIGRNRNLKILNSTGNKARDKKMNTETHIIIKNMNLHKNKSHYVNKVVHTEVPL